MAEIASLLASWGTITAAIVALLSWDERRMNDAQRARAWPVASRRSAVVVFGALAVPVHFWRTRRGLRGIALGLGWLAVVLLLDAAVTTALDLALGDPSRP